MSTSAGVSPAQQIQLLTRGVLLPLPPLNRRILRTLARGICRVWDELLADFAGRLLASSEPEITALMIHKLNALTDEDPRWNQLVKAVTRGAESVNFNGKALEKRPDVSFTLKNRSPNFPLVAECKLIDFSSNKSVGLYCHDGLSRFLLGDYAWAAREAFMIAYVRDDSTIDTTLKPYLVKYQRKTPDPFATVQPTVPMPDVPGDSGPSFHARSFRYLGRSPGEPGEITLWHMWLSQVSTHRHPS